MARDYSLSVAAAMWRYAEDCADKERRNTIMTTKTDTITLPPFPDTITKLPIDHDGNGPLVWKDDEVRAYARAAVEADRQSQADAEIDIADVRQYLDQWGCLAHPGVRALVDRYGSSQPAASAEPFMHVWMADDGEHVRYWTRDPAQAARREVDFGKPPMRLFAIAVASPAGSSAIAAGFGTFDPDDRFFHAADKSWWRRGDDGMLVRAEAPQTAVSAGPNADARRALEIASNLRKDFRDDTHNYDTMLGAATLLESFAATAAPVAQEPVGDPLSWLETEIDAVSCRHYGDPTYDHDAYWFKRQALKLVAQARRVFATPVDAQASLQNERQNIHEIIPDQTTAQDREDAARWREVAERFDQAKTSACERILDALELDASNAHKALEPIIDAARAAKGADHG